MLIENQEIGNGTCKEVENEDDISKTSGYELGVILSPIFGLQHQKITADVSKVAMKNKIATINNDEKENEQTLETIVATFTSKSVVSNNDYYDPNPTVTTTIAALVSDILDEKK